MPPLERKKLLISMSMTRREDRRRRKVVIIDARGALLKFEMLVRRLDGAVRHVNAQRVCVPSCFTRCMDSGRQQGHGRIFIPVALSWVPKRRSLWGDVLPYTGGHF